MELPSDLQYTKSHEWVRLEGDTALVGITSYDPANAACSMRVELPDVGASVKAGDFIARVFFVDASEEIVAPLSGTIREINLNLTTHPELLHTDPYQSGWIFRIQMEAGEEIEHLMDVATYQKSVGDEPFAEI